MRQCATTLEAEIRPDELAALLRRFAAPSRKGPAWKSARRPAELCGG